MIAHAVICVTIRSILTGEDAARQTRKIAIRPDVSLTATLDRYRTKIEEAITGMKAAIRAYQQVKQINLSPGGTVVVTIR
jgi:hypothetical protein